MTSYVIRTAVHTDAAMIARLAHGVMTTTYGTFVPSEQQGAFAAHYREPEDALWARRIAVSGKNGFIRVAGDRRTVAGFYRAVAVKDGLFITNFYVSPSAQGKGVGRLLFSDALRQAGPGAVSLEVVAANIHATGFYERMGMTDEGPASGTYYGLPKRRMTTGKRIDKSN